MIQKNKPEWKKFNYEPIPEMPDCYFIEFDLRDKPTYHAMIIYHKNLGYDLKSAKDYIVGLGDKIVFTYKEFEEWHLAIEEFTQLFLENISWKIYCNDELKGGKPDHMNSVVIALAAAN